MLLNSLISLTAVISVAHASLEVKRHGRLKVKVQIPEYTHYDIVGREDRMIRNIMKGKKEPEIFERDHDYFTDPVQEQWDRPEQSIHGNDYLYRDSKCCTIL